MEKIVLQRSGKRPLSFEGEPLASYETSPDRAFSNWSGSTGRWQEIKLYKTKSGRFVVWEAHRSQWQGEGDDLGTSLFDSLEEAITYLEKASPRAAAELAGELGVHEAV